MQDNTTNNTVSECTDDDTTALSGVTPPTVSSEKTPTEYGGPKGKEPTRYGDWEKNGRCIDF